MKLVRKTLENLPWGRPQPTARWPQHLCMDKGYDFREVRDLVAEFGLTARICSRGEEAKALRRNIGYRARRCRRTFAQLDQSMPRLARSLGKEGQELYGVLALGLRHHYLACLGPTGIGSKPSRSIESILLKL